MSFIDTIKNKKREYDKKKDFEATTNRLRMQRELNTLKVKNKQRAKDQQLKNSLRKEKQKAYNNSTVGKTLNVVGKTTKNYLEKNKKRYSEKKGGRFGEDKELKW